MGRRLRVALGLLAAALLAAGVAGCGSMGYLAQSAHGHITLMNAARPVQEWIHDPATPQALAERLKLADAMRDFSVSELHLPDNNSYRRFADLKRGAAVWNVVAAPELSLKLQTHCYPFVGCVGYRGFYDRATADREAAKLKAQGLEVAVYGVPAYSTLGWTNWFGGDPLLSTFIQYPEGELARMIFHELAHQVAYAKDDTMFNESFATSVEVIGGQRWLQRHAGEGARQEFAKLDARRRDFRELTLRYREQLEKLYKGPLPEAEKRERKATLMQQMRDEYARMKAERWGGYAGYDAWFKNANNASLGVQAAYSDLVPNFQRLFEREGGDFERFYAEVKRLAALPKPERRATLGAPVTP
jgi:predicted aminopeptidase